MTTTPLHRNRSAGRFAIMIRAPQLDDAEWKSLDHVGSIKVDGGALILLDDDGRLEGAFGPGFWTNLYRLPS